MRKAFIILYCMVLCVCFGASAEITQDRAGNPISVPENVRSIVSLAPAITQVLVDLGLEDRLVAIDTYSAQVLQINGIIEMDMMAPDIERIVSLSPDLILASNMTLVNDPDSLLYLSESGSPIVVIPSSSSIEAIVEDVRFIGALVGKAAEADALCAPLFSAIERLSVQMDDPIPVYFEIGSSPALYSFGKDTFLNELIEILGGQNIFAAQSGWLNVSEEAIVAAAPEIIFTNEGWVGDAVSLIMQRPGWESVPAIKNGKVFLIDDNITSQPNHHIADALEAISEAFR